MTDDPQHNTTEIPEVLLDQLTRRGWAITRLGKAEAGYWFGTAEYLTGSPFDAGPEFLFSVREATRDACVAKLRELVGDERRKGLWTEVAGGAR